MAYGIKGIAPPRPLIVVSNREPYHHTRRDDGSIDVTAATGGVAVALDALMRQRSGTWVAHGSADADLAVVDQHDRVAVPPDSPAYLLRRLWITADEERRYYRGFANEGLWPLCHLAHVRPVFRADDWAAYRTVNARFADAVATEIKTGAELVFIQDYHLALMAASLRARRPLARTAIFWHIPWPHADSLRICPWRREILRGLLANDVVAFQLDRDRRNFLQSVRDELRAPIDGDRVFVGHREVRVMTSAIGVDVAHIQQMAADPDLAAESSRLRRVLGLDDPALTAIGIGVDRLDYTKGIAERLDAIDALLTRRPDLRSHLAFVQVGVPSRSTIAAYSQVERDIDARVAWLNVKHGAGPDRGPVRYRKSAMTLRELTALYRLADFAVVSSLHDGMNLVAKEFVAARTDDGGVLVLSEMAGAAEELKDALLFNPYDADGFARAIEQAILMPSGERAIRMRSLRRTVTGRDVFRWAEDILNSLDRAHAPAHRLEVLPSRLPAGYLRPAVIARRDVRG
jgi:trehalose-6-phosphate synthase